ncbi:transcription antitermination factor NusB [Paenactinomyces guangxiensis]|uniref:Transcription antitermination protein NusB n=1 Tax=Paenactinomyces guangxiensis TaxID=1490290 RepID=A0A7W1WSG5_9BACL|nr:transcription antitermination factor NusB [Paenactinomyces guangxiensis]MBA4494996.1 transcription antitermination factor NusB [Paenactinomyces guangxiensis]MBH8592079.1 transcription antitermination factor NusB [Paenactinomyces guangxiensis]
MSRRTARESALQALYQLEFYPENEGFVIRERGEELKGPDYTFFKEITLGVRKHLSVIDPLIRRFLKKGWSLERISSVDRTILRLAAYELLFEKKVPRGVVLNEAVDLAKVFSSEESSRFINGVLGRLAGELDKLKAELENQA